MNGGNRIEKLIDENDQLIKENIELKDLVASLICKVDVAAKIISDFDRQKGEFIKESAELLTENEKLKVENIGSRKSVVVLASAVEMVTEKNEKLKAEVAHLFAEVVDLLDLHRRD